MMVFFSLVTYAAYLAFTIYQARRTGNRRHAWAWAALFAAGIAVQVLYEMGVDVPGPAEPIKALVSGMFKLK